MKREIITRTPQRKRYVFLRLGIGVFYSEPNSGLVLKWETHWSKISGFWINTPWGCWWLRFRRFYHNPSTRC